jgi:hypothetical protein
VYWHWCTLGADTWLSLAEPSMIHTLGLRVAQGAGCWRSSCAASPAVYAAVRSRAVGLSGGDALALTKSQTR